MTHHQPAGEILTMICPIKPDAHGRSIQAYECTTCGTLIIGCLDGCTPDDILEALGIPTDDAAGVRGGGS